jgi:hypothetical protein
LRDGDAEKLSPVSKEQLKTAISTQVRTGILAETIVQKPKQTSWNRETDTSPDLPEAWLWYQLLIPNSDVNSDIVRFESNAAAF